MQLPLGEERLELIVYALLSDLLAAQASDLLLLPLLLLVLLLSPSSSSCSSRLEADKLSVF